MHPKNVSPSQSLQYYFQPDPVFGVDACWYGHLAERYGLYNLVCKKHDFANLITGNDLSGNQVIKSGRDTDDKEFHRAAVDFTLSPPKSFSMVAVHGGDLKLQAAHLAAIDATLNYIEANYIYVRQTKFCNTVAAKTGEGLFAKVNHSVSRANDPNLHTHCLIFNHTHGPKGPQAVFFDQLYRDQKLIIQIYLSQLANNVKELGYGIDVKSNGSWEISGIKQEWIEHFSKRSHSIKKVEKEFSETSRYSRANQSKLRKIAVLQSRPSKDHSMDGVQLKEQWEEQVPRRLILQALEKAKYRVQQEDKLKPVDYIRLAYQSIHETECLFTRKQILESCLNLGVGNVTAHELEKSFLKMRAAGEILDVSTYVNSKGITTQNFTSAHMKETEQEILKAFCDGINSLEPLISSQKAEQLIRTDHAHLTADQQVALQNILSSKDQCTLLQGDAGTGKSFLFKSLKEILEGRERTLRIEGVGFTGKAAQELQSKSGIASKTISSFLNESVQKSHKNGIVIIDEASMLGSMQASEVFFKAKCNNSRVILCGDCKQLQAISAGNFFKDLQTLGASRIELTHVIRQKNIVVLKEVRHVKNFLNGKNRFGIDKTFELLSENGQLVEKRYNSELIRAVAGRYLSDKSCDDTLIIASSNHERMQLNKLIRSTLQNQGLLGRENHEIQISVPVSLTGLKKFFAENFEVGQCALIEQRDQENRENQYFDSVIVSGDSRSNTINVLTSDNMLKQFKLRDQLQRINISLYETQKRNFSTGDKIIFLKNDKKLGIQNGLTGTVERIEKNRALQVRIKKFKRLVEIVPGKYPWFDHSYSISLHKAQGQTSSNVLFLANTRNKRMNKTESLYVALSRAENQVTIFTDNATKLKGQFKEGQYKTSSLLSSKNIIKSNTEGKMSEMEVEK